MWPSSAPTSHPSSLVPASENQLCLWCGRPTGQDRGEFQRRGCPPCTPLPRAVFFYFLPFTLSPPHPYLHPFLCWIGKSLLQRLWAAHYPLLTPFLYPAICSSWLWLGLADPESQPCTWNPAPLACSLSGLIITPFPSWP